MRTITRSQTRTQMSNVPRNVMLNHILPKLNPKNAVRFSMASKEYHANTVGRGARVTAGREFFQRLFNTSAPKVASLITRVCVIRRKHPNGVSVANLPIPHNELEDVNTYHFEAHLAGKLTVAVEMPKSGRRKNVVHVYFSTDPVYSVAQQSYRLAVKNGVFVVTKHSPFRFHVRSSIVEWMCKSIMTAALRKYRAHPVQAW